MSASGGTASVGPDVLADYVEVAGFQAVQAVRRGDRSEAARLLTDALRAIQAPALRVVGGGK